MDTAPIVVKSSMIQSNGMLRPIFMLIGSIDVIIFCVGFVGFCHALLTGFRCGIFRVFHYTSYS